MNMFPAKLDAMVIIQWLEVFGVQWLEDVGFMNHQQPVWFKSDQPWSFQIACTVTYVTCLVVVGSWSFLWHVSWQAQMIQPVTGCIICACHGSLCAPERAGQAQNSGQLCLLLWIFIRYCGIRAIRWNKPLSHSGTAVWRSVHSWLLFGCQGRPSWIRRSGTRFQCWHNSRQCLRFVGSDNAPTIRAQLCRFWYYVSDHR